MHKLNCACKWSKTTSFLFANFVVTPGIESPWFYLMNITPPTASPRCPRPVHTDFLAQSRLRISGIVRFDWGCVDKNFSHLLRWYDLWRHRLQLAWDWKVFVLLEVSCCIGNELVLSCLKRPWRQHSGHTPLCLYYCFLREAQNYSHFEIKSYHVHLFLSPVLFSVPDIGQFYVYHRKLSEHWPECPRIGAVQSLGVPPCRGIEQGLSLFSIFDNVHSSVN